MRRALGHWGILGAIIVAVSLCGCGSGTESEQMAPSEGGTPASPKPVAEPKTAPAETTQAEKPQGEPSGPKLGEPANQAAFITLATTTSFFDTGLAQKLADQFTKETGIGVKILAKGTGEALKLGEDGNADVLVVHAPASEQKLVDSGACVERVTFMHNAFLVVGPEADPAKVAEATDEQDAFRHIAEAGAPFRSRGDNSGTHKKELAIWKAINITPKPGTGGYGETGKGMGETLLVANQQNAYCLTDIGTYLKYKAEGRIALANLCDKGKMLYNPYSVMLVNPEKFDPGVIKVNEARKFAAFLQRSDIQKEIGEYMRDEFKQSLFTPDLLPKDQQ